MFQVAIFIALQPLSIFEFMFTGLPYAPAMPTATESDQRKSALVVFASSKKWDYTIPSWWATSRGHSTKLKMIVILRAIRR